MFLNKKQQSTVQEHLTQILHRYSDAESHVLSEYIVALLAKDGTAKQIRSDCDSELAAFMGEKTEQFVNELFDFIEDNVFDTTPGGDRYALILTLSVSLCVGSALSICFRVLSPFILPLRLCGVLHSVFCSILMVSPFTAF